MNAVLVGFEVLGIDALAVVGSDTFGLNVLNLLRFLKTFPLSSLPIIIPRPLTIPSIISRRRQLIRKNLLKHRALLWQVLQGLCLNPLPIGIIPRTTRRHRLPINNRLALLSQVPLLLSSRDYAIAQVRAKLGGFVSLVDQCA